MVVDAAEVGTVCSRLDVIRYCVCAISAVCFQIPDPLFQVTKPCPLSRRARAAVLLKVYRLTLTTVCRCTACAFTPCTTLLVLETCDWHSSVDATGCDSCGDTENVDAGGVVSGVRGCMARLLVACDVRIRFDGASAVSSASSSARLRF